ncbi:MAG TPA: ATP-binding protein [Gemmatimonadaceae bacterium]|nr:ATP-binding protein [Gemmatimonadaceae bacterium]
MTSRAHPPFPPYSRTVCDESQAFAYFRTHGRSGDTEFASPSLGARLAAAIVRLAARELGAPSAALHVVAGGVIRPIARLTGDAPRSPTPITAAEPLAGSLDAEVLSTGAPLAIADGPPARLRPPMKRVVALLGVPVPGPRGEPTGVLWVGDRRPRQWSGAEIETVRSLAREIAAGLPPDAGVRDASRSWKAELLFLLTAESPIGLYAVDERDGSVLIHNRCFLEIFGLEEHASRFDGCDISHGEVLSRVSVQTSHPRAIRRVLTRISDPAVRRTIDSETLLTNGRRVHCYSAQIRDEGDAYLGRCYLIEDVTGRRRLERDALEQTRTHRELEERLRQSQKLEAIGRFAGGLAHDFNNVLSVVLSTSELALTGIAPETALWRDLDTIRAAARHGAGLTRRLLAIGRREPEHRESLDISEVVAETVPMIERMLPESIKLLVMEQSDGTRARADRHELQQVLLNLASNARDALPDGGTITIATRALRVPDDAHPTRVPDGHWVRLTVRDDGTGIAPEARDRLFEPFFTTKPPGKGTGLGLATVYGIVLHSQGHIVVESEPGNTRVEIYWPADS